MVKPRSTREKILRAAAELTHTEGAAHLSLDAVAVRAGLSKGGLLYNFPSKSALLCALVQYHIEEFSKALDERLSDCNGACVAAEYFDLALEELGKPKPPPSGLLAALSENPELLTPVRRFSRVLLDRMKSGSGDEAVVLLIFMVLEGMRCQKLFGTEVLSPDEQALLIDRLSAMLKGECPAPSKT